MIYDAIVAVVGVVPIGLEREVYLMSCVFYAFIIFSFTSILFKVISKLSGC